MGSLFSIIPIINAFTHLTGTKDYRLWYVVGRSVIDGQPLYDDVKGGEPEFMYPPTAAVLIYAPLSCLNQVLFTALLCLSTSVSWAFAFWAGRVLLTGRWTDRLDFLSLAPGIAVASYVWDLQLLGQLNLLLLAMTLGSFVALRRGSPWTAGLLLGAAAAIKVFPLPAMAYFVVRREWKAVAATLLGMFLFAWLLPGAVRGFERNTTELHQWARMMVADQSGQTMAGRSSIGFTRRNQSLVSLSHRLLRHVDAGDHRKRPLFVNIANLSPMAAQYVGYASCLLLGLILLISCRFQFGQSIESEGLEIAMVCTLVPLCSPLAWTYYFCWLLPASIAMGHWLFNPVLSTTVRRNLMYAVIASVVLLFSAVSEQFDPTLQALGVTAIGSVIVFLALAYVRFNLTLSCSEIDARSDWQADQFPPAAIARRAMPK